MQKLLERSQNGYSSCAEDICNELKGRTFEDIWQITPRLSGSADVRIIKIRIQNSQSRKSKSAGFRLVVVADKRSETVVFLSVFPKLGRLAKNNLTDRELESIISSFKTERDAKALIPHDINNNLQQIELPVVGESKI